MDRKIEKKKFLIPTKYWPWAVGGTVILALLAWLATGSYTSVLKVERESLIISPVITEASMDMMNQKKYVFKVMTSATKPEIANAVEVMFGVKVAAVNTMMMKRKEKRVRYNYGYTAEWKKAIVTLTEDSKTIAFFDGMN